MKFQRIIFPGYPTVTINLPVSLGVLLHNSSKTATLRPIKAVLMDAEGNILSTVPLEYEA